MVQACHHVVTISSERRASYNVAVYNPSPTPTPHPHPSPHPSPHPNPTLIRYNVAVAGSIVLHDRLAKRKLAALAKESNRRN